MSDFSFDSENEDVEDGFELMPVHEATWIVEKSEWKTTKSGLGEMLILVCKEVSGPHKGRLIWLRFNLINPNAKAVNIAKGQLKPLLFACNHPVLSKTNASALHNKPFLAKCTIDPGNDGFEDSNTLKNITNIKGEKPPKKGETAPQQPEKKAIQTEEPTAAASTSSEDDDWFDD